MNTGNTSILDSPGPQSPPFEGFPYLVTAVTSDLYHIHLLPRDERYGCHRLPAIARRQVYYNRLPACLVLDRQRGVYFGRDGLERESHQIPWGGQIMFGRPVLCEPLPETEELSRRRAMLQDFAARSHASGSWALILGDLTKGGRLPTEDENRRLRGRQESGVPVGLTRCPECGQRRGEGFDKPLQDLIVTVSCSCSHDTLCAGCGRSFDQRRLNSNNYSEADGTIRHVPSLAALDRPCPEFDARGDRSRGCGPFIIYRCREHGGRMPLHRTVRKGGRNE